MSNYDRSYLIATAVDYQNAVAAERYFASLQEDDEEEPESESESEPQQ